MTILRRWLVQAVALALVLPVLIGALPQAALSASEALERDLLASACSPGTPQPQDHQHRAQHEHCILCSSHCQGWAPGLAAAAPGLAAWPRGAAPVTLDHLALAPPRSAWRDASPPRAPPATA